MIIINREPDVDRSEAYKAYAEGRASGQIILPPLFLSKHERRLHVRRTLREDHQRRSHNRPEGAQKKFDKLASLGLDRYFVLVEGWSEDKGTGNMEGDAEKRILQSIQAEAIQAEGFGDDVIDFAANASQRVYADYALFQRDHALGVFSFYTMPSPKDRAHPSEKSEKDEADKSSDTHQSDEIRFIGFHLTSCVFSSS